MRVEINTLPIPSGPLPQAVPLSESRVSAGIHRLLFFAFLIDISDRVFVGLVWREAEFYIKFLIALYRVVASAAVFVASDAWLKVVRELSTRILHIATARLHVK